MASVPESYREFIDDLARFSTASMTWCSHESEKAAAKVGDILHLLLEDAGRVSKMSQETIDALKKMQESMEQVKAGGEAFDTRGVIRGLAKLANQNVEVQEIANPIINSLQFQDRIRQNMENLSKMFGIWSKFRQEHEGEEESDELLQAFGNKLFEVTTMKSERDIIRGSIPGLPEEQVTEDVLLF